MKGKLLIALAVLALVFGMAACDNGVRPEMTNSATNNIEDGLMPKVVPPSGGTGYWAGHYYEPDNDGTWKWAQNQGWNAAWEEKTDDDALGTVYYKFFTPSDGLSFSSVNPY
jgi:hypothetical protein